MIDPGRLERTACDAAREAGAALLDRFGARAPIAIETKGLHDFVTEADHAAEALIVRHLRERFPDHAIMSEEGSPDAARDTYRWIVDPLDATTNFIHGVPLFSVSIGVEGPDGLLAGAVYDPLRDEMFHGARGGGARLNGKPISCSRAQTLDDALIATGFPFRQPSRLDGYLDTLAAFVRAAAGLRRAGCATLDLAYVACGRYDGFWELGLKPWDIAAGALLVHEAGGQVTDVVGGPDYLSGDIVAAVPAIHAQMLEILARSGERTA